jgi:hypothetical protein
MKEVTLIQCTDSKRESIAMAKNLYDESDYFRKMRKWAEAQSGSWFILSAKHGLVPPNKPLEPYDEYGLSDSQAVEIALLINGLGFDVVHLCAGRAYTDRLVPELEKEGLEVLNYFAGLGIGERKQKLNAKANELLNGSL